LRNLRQRKGGTWLDLGLLVLFSALGAAGIVYIASKGVKINDYEVLNWAIVTWLWPFLSVSTSNLDPTVTLVLSWLALFALFLFAGVLATFVPGLRSAGPSVFLRELTRLPEPAAKPETAAAENEEPKLEATAAPDAEVAPELSALPEAPSDLERPDSEVVVEPEAPVWKKDELESQAAVPSSYVFAPVALTPVGAQPDVTPGQTDKPVARKARSRRGRGAVWRRVAFFFLPLAISMACFGAAIPLFTELNKYNDPVSVTQNWWVNNGSWLLWIASMLFFGLAFLYWGRTTRPPEEGENPNPPGDRFPRWLEWAVVLGLFGVALYFRVKDLETVPAGLWFDEGQDGIVGRQLVSPNGGHWTFIGDFTQMGALLWYFMGLLAKIMGNTVIAVRIIPAVAGALIAPMLYLIGSRLYGWRAGLAAGGLVAILDWNLTWSRIGMASMPTVAMVVGVYLCIVQALRTGRLGYYAAAGILLGLALHMYYVSKLVPVILIGILAARLITERMKLIRSIRVGVIVFAVGAIIAFMPVGLFAMQRSTDYNARTDIVSVFSILNSPTEPSLRANLESNVKRHVLMFNWEGDGNGRHNLPGTPMLDWITAALFFAGLASCVLRAWRWQYLFPVVWTVAGMAGGVLTLPFEAPQSHRALELSVVAALVAGIFIGEAWNAILGAAQIERITSVFRWLFRRGRVAVADIQSRPRALAWPMRVAWVIGAATLLYVVWQAGILNTHKYFDVQAQDLSVVKDMQAPQAEAARRTLLYGQEYDVFVTPLWQGNPQAQYLAPDVQTNQWTGLHSLPLNPGRSGGSVIILDLPSAADVAMIARMYPNAQFEIYTASSNPEPLVITIKIPDADIRANRGVMTTHYEDGTGKPGAQKVIPDFAYNWSAQGAKVGTNRFATTLKVEQFGTYNFTLKSASGDESAGQLLVDGYDVRAGDPVTLGLGLHSVVATDTVRTPSGVTQLLWGPVGNTLQPVPSVSLFDPTKLEPHGLTGTYRQNTTYEGPAQLGRVDPVISYYFHQTPLSLPFTAVWEGKIYIPEEGSYTIGTEQLSNSTLYIDDQQPLVNANINQLVENTYQLSQGLHDIRLEYLDAGSASHMYLYWAPPGRPRNIIPSVFLWPKMGQYPAKPETGSWPALDQSNGTEFPPDRTIYSGPRPAEAQSSPGGSNQPPPVSQPPAAAPEQPSSPGRAFQPLFLVGDKAGVPGRPKSAAADKDGNIYIYTERDSTMHKYDPEGAEITSWQVKNSSGPVTEGSGLVVRDDKVYLLDAGSSDLIGFTLDGKPADNLHLCTCFFPRDVRLSPDGSFWVANTGSGQVLKVSGAGQQMVSLGMRGDQPGQFNEPAGVWEAPDGTLYVADVSNKRMQSFTPDLKPLAQWNIGQTVARDGDRITGDSQGNVLLTQTEGHAVVLYDKNGKELNRWVYKRAGAELIPAGIAALGDDKFIVLFPENETAAVFTTVEK
jgi:4-amino-4-deoxy-L-arabinose transferase-like glycosyltransferase/sugar lactone lactonase YvrE